MKCPKCEKETTYSYQSDTLLGYFDKLIDGVWHHHDDNCRKRYYSCICGNTWIESIIRTCKTPGCQWTGKTKCFCHKGAKVKEWTDK